MRVLIIGGGPAGLYAGVLLKKADPRRDISIIERNPRGATYGWGVVFSDRTLSHFREADAITYEAINDAFVVWDAIDIRFKGQVIRCGGNVFAGMARRRLLEILEERCEQLGVPVRHEVEFKDFAQLTEYDLVIAADGINSTVRPALADTFRPSNETGKARYIWYGTHRVFDSFTFSIRPNEHGLFQAHAYPFDGETSTFIVECAEETWRSAGLDQANEAESIEYCEALFAEDLRGRNLLSNNSKWINFVTVKNRKWHHQNIVLLGDAAHTAHFSIGSGTKLAMEDAIALAHAFEVYDSAEEALVNYELDRRPRVVALQDAARESQDYFEMLRRYIHLEPPQFAFHLLTRSGRLNYDNLKLRDAGYVDQVERWFCDTATLRTGLKSLIAPPPIFTPLRLRSASLNNRVVLSAPPHDEAVGGMVSETSATDIRRLAEGGAALVLTERVAVSAEGRITEASPGLYCDDHTSAWSGIVRAAHEADARIGVTLSHAGRRGATLPRTAGLDRPLPAERAWGLMAPSAIPYAIGSQRPKAMDEADMEAVCTAFVSAARRAKEAGFDILVLDMAHGYLLGSFLSPLTNQRSDAYGDSAENRSRFPLEVFDAVRAVWPEDRPISVALNASDWARGGVDMEEVVDFARQVKARGCDLICLLAGQTTPEVGGEYGLDALTAYSERLRNEVHIATMAGGGITTTNQANTILAGGRADLILMDLWLPEDE